MSTKGPLPQEVLCDICDPGWIHSLPLGQKTTPISPRMPVLHQSSPLVRSRPRSTPTPDVHSGDSSYENPPRKIRRIQSPSNPSQPVCLGRPLPAGPLPESPPRPSGPLESSPTISDSLSASIESQAPYEGVASPAGSPAPPGIPISVQHEFRRQDQSRTTIGSQWRGQQSSDLIDIEFLEYEVARWKDRCWTCFLSGADDGHELFHCTNAASATARDWYRTNRGQVRYARYSACFGCGMPQTICLSWQTRGSCGYKHVLLPMYAMMVYSSSALVPHGLSRTTIERIQGQWECSLQQREINPSDPSQVVQFLGQEAPRGSVRQTELVQGFIWLRRAFDRYSL